MLRENGASFIIWGRFGTLPRTPDAPQPAPEHACMHVSTAAAHVPLYRPSPPGAPLSTGPVAAGLSVCGYWLVGGTAPVPAVSHNRLSGCGLWAIHFRRRLWAPRPRFEFCPLE